MRDFIATTESGATYTVEGGMLRIEGSRAGNTRFSVYRMASRKDPTTLPWDPADPWATAAAPIPGERLYLGGRDEWRISSAIRTVVFLEVDDD